MAKRERSRKAATKMLLSSQFSLGLVLLMGPEISGCRISSRIMEQISQFSKQEKNMNFRKYWDEF